MHPTQVPTAAPHGHSSFAAAAYAKQDQEDAQEFLQYLLDHAHLVRGSSASWLFLLRASGSRLSEWMRDVLKGYGR